MSGKIYKALRWLLLTTVAFMLIFLSNSQYPLAKYASADPIDTPNGNKPGQTDTTQPTSPLPSGTEPVGGNIEPGRTIPHVSEPTEPFPGEQPDATNPVVQLPQKDLPLSKTNSILKNYGKMTSPGMKSEVYNQVMSRPWIDAKDYINDAENITINLNEKIDNEKYYELLKKLSRYDGVYLYEIGETTDGLPIYSISIDFQSDKPKEVYMFVGQVHAREFAGGVFILKMFADLVQKAQTDASVQSLLKNVKYVAVPIINLDVRQKIIDGDPYFSGDQNDLWKDAVDGVELNRNYPGINAGMLAKGLSPAGLTSSHANARGSYFGSAQETQAMMKWLHHYIVNEKAVYLADVHQMGRVMYSGKPWDTAAGEARCKSVSQKVLDYINRGNNEKYYFIPESLNYGLRGEGSSITDYAMSLAFGAKYSEAFGINVYVDSKGNEYTLLQIPDLDKSPVKFEKASPRFVAATYEIGIGNAYLGYSASTRRLIAEEYTKYHFDTLLEVLPDLVQ